MAPVSSSTSTPRLQLGAYRGLREACRPQSLLKINSVHDELGQVLLDLVRL